MKQIRWPRLCVSAKLLVISFAMLLGLGASAQARGAAVRIIYPRQDATVWGTTQIKLKVTSEAQRVDVYIDDNYLASGPPYTISWNSTEISDGPHTITAAVFGGAATNPFLASTSSSHPVQILATQRVKVKVRNHGSTPPPTATPTAAPSPDPTVSPTPLAGFSVIDARDDEVVRARGHDAEASAGGRKVPLYHGHGINEST